MNASNAPFAPPPRRRPRRARRSKSRRPSSRSLAIETSLKLGANVIFCMVAISAIFRLLPSQMKVRENFREMQAETDRVEKRVRSLQAEFGRYFDPQQTDSILQEQGYQTDPHRLPIVWDEGDR